MKVYMIYFLDMSTNRNIEYAITNSKSKLSEFMKYRNSEVYTVKIIDVNKNYYLKLEEDYSDKILKLIKFNSIDEKYHTYSVWIMSNEYEKSIVGELNVTLHSWVSPIDGTVPYKIFSDKSREALCNLRYDIFDILYTININEMDGILYVDSNDFEDIYSEFSYSFNINEVNCLLAIMRGDILGYLF